MERWNYLGDLDLFGLDAETAQAWWQALQAEAWETGGELQVVKLDDQLDTLRYRFSLEWTSLAKPFGDLLAALVQILPEDHPDMKVQGYDRGNCQRQDWLFSKREVFLVLYEWVACPAIKYSHPDANEKVSSIKPLVSI